jgi:ABC-type lipoprotein export system ATPase subunit
MLQRPGAAVVVRDLTHEYRLHEGSLRVLDAVGFDIDAGAYVALVGPSGSGKSTLLSILGGLESPQAGRTEVDGHDLRQLAGDDLAAFRRTTVGFVFQHFGLLDAHTAEENEQLATANFMRSNCSVRSASVNDWITVPRSSAVVSVSVWRSPAPSSTSPDCCSPTSRRATSTPSRPSR